MKSLKTNPSNVIHEWSKEALFAKAQKYAEEMRRYPKSDWQFPFWSTLCLESLARAALSHISPTLLADHKNWLNLHYSLGLESFGEKFVPNSITISEVVNRLTKLLPAFVELKDFMAEHMIRRNAEVHAGDNVFVGLKESDWLPHYYRTCEILLQSMGEELEALLGKDESNIAKQYIHARQDEAAKAVKKEIETHKSLWNDKNSTDRGISETQALAWSARWRGHRAICPACGCAALLFGEPHSKAIKTISGHQITEIQVILPTRFQCVACGLQISGFAKLMACGLGDTFTSKRVYNAADYYGMVDEHSGLEPDNNEP